MGKYRNFFVTTTCFTRLVNSYFCRMNTIVRTGVKADLPQLLNLIKELAVYEKAENEVIVTLNDLEKDGFGEHKIFDFFVAESEGKITGIALYYTKYSTWKGKCIFLEDIIVSESARGKGIGKLLFEAVVKAAKEKNAKRVEWQVLDWNEPAIKFYQRYDAQFLKEWLSCRLDESDILRIAAES